MEDKKRLTATKAAIAKFREEHPTFTDEYLAASVENTYPDLYLDNLEVAWVFLKPTGKLSSTFHGSGKSTPWKCIICKS